MRGMKERDPGRETWGPVPVTLVKIKCDFRCRQKDAVSRALWSVFGGLLQRAGAAFSDDLH